MSLFGRIFGRGEPAEPGPRLPGVEGQFRASEGRGYREVRTLASTDPRTGERVIRSGVGVSLRSAAEARVMAEEQARQALEDVRSGRREAHGGYAYFADKLLEPLLEVLRGESGDVARITVNGYGAIVMNATGALFADVDANEDQGPTGGSLPQGLAQALEAHPELALRTYRTRAGWRYLCTNRTFDPTSEETRELLRAFGTDDRYILLCRAQRSFRARLTPKPWRARQRPLAISPGQEVARDDLQRYVDQTWRFATARFVSSVGPSEISPELAELVDYHDRWTQAASTKPLA